MARVDLWIAHPAVGERVHFVASLPGADRRHCWPADIVTVHPSEPSDREDDLCCSLWVLAHGGLLWRSGIFRDPGLRPETWHTREECDCEFPSPEAADDGEDDGENIVDP